MVTIYLRHGTDMRLSKRAFAGFYLVGTLVVALGVNLTPIQGKVGLFENMWLAGMGVFLLTANVVFVLVDRRRPLSGAPRPFDIPQQ